MAAATEESDDYVFLLNSVAFPRKLLQKFISEYKTYPCLWNKLDPGYKHKPRRHEAISALTKLVQEHDPSATRVHVLRKIESLRACVRRERKRVVESRRVAETPEEIYQPNLWYYELFSFVWECESTTEEPPVKKRAKAAQHVRVAPVPVAEEDEEEEAHHSYDDDHSSEPSYSGHQSHLEKQYHDYEEATKEKRHCTEVADEYDAIGINVAAKLRSLPYNMRVLSEKLINDVLYQAQLNALNSSTTLATQDPFKTEPA